MILGRRTSVGSPWYLDMSFGSFTSFPPSRHVRFAPRADIRTMRVFRRTAQKRKGAFFWFGARGNGIFSVCPLLAFLPPQQSNLSRHRTSGFAHSCSASSKLADDYGPL